MYVKFSNFLQRGKRTIKNIVKWLNSFLFSGIQWKDTFGVRISDKLDRSKLPLLIHKALRAADVWAYYIDEAECMYKFASVECSCNYQQSRAYGIIITFMQLSSENT